jgi:hypothetical protein
MEAPMLKTIGRSATAATIAAVVTFGLAATSSAQGPPCPLATGAFDFDFAGSQYADCFRDVVRGGAINAGEDFGGTGHTSLNIAGSGAAGGRTWITVVDQDPSTPAADVVFASGTVCADVLIQRFNNTKGAGVVALYNQNPLSKGLALILYDAGNSDSLTLATVAGDENGGLTPLTRVPLGSAIAENNWYRVVMTVAVNGMLEVRGQVYKHAVGTDPNSAIEAIGPALTFGPQAFPAGVLNQGEEGIIGSAIGAVENSSVTNFTNVREKCLNTAAPGVS